MMDYVVPDRREWSTLTDAEKEALGGVKIAAGRWRMGVIRDGKLITAQEAQAQDAAKERAPAVWSADTFQSGRSRFQTHGGCDIGPNDIIEDLAGDKEREVCEQMGHPYVRLPDGREGPAAFGSFKKMEHMMRESGNRPRDRGEGNQPDPLEVRKKQFKQKYGREWTPLPLDSVTINPEDL